MSKTQYEKGFKPDLKGKGKEVKDADKVPPPMIFLAPSITDAFPIAQA